MTPDVATREALPRWSLSHQPNVSSAPVRWQTFSGSPRLHTRKLSVNHPLAPPLLSSPDWHRSLAAAIRDPETLIDALGLSPDLKPPARKAAKLFPLLVPLSFVRRMRYGDSDDPLLRQVLPLGVEGDDVPGFTHDPVDDSEFRIAPGLLRKYSTRALLIATGSCAVHCRYCFRRHYPYDDEPKRWDDWQPTLDALAADPGVDEVILSGGDPLMLTDSRLETLICRLAEIPHLHRLRIHSRLPIVLPDRVTDELLAILLQTRLTPIFVVHANHAAEVVDDCADSLRKLGRGGVTTLNQAVLLRGVNDSVEAQRSLCLSLADVGVLPYYLHQLDRVAGAAHFEVPLEVGRSIVRELRTCLPGYAVPRFVQEQPGSPSKTVLE